MHGPAATIDLEQENLTVHSGEIDIVLAVRLQAWPTVAKEWCTRKRHYNWPTQDFISTCAAGECYLVPVSHPHSSNKDLEWRFSFSEIEKALALSLNAIQVFVYRLFKLFIHTLFKEVRSHCYISSENSVILGM